MDCIFCKIISGEIPSYKIYEDEYVLLQASKHFKCKSCHLLNECDVNNPFFAKCKAAMNDGNPLVPVSKSKTK